MYDQGSVYCEFMYLIFHFFPIYEKMIPTPPGVFWEEVYNYTPCILLIINVKEYLTDCIQYHVRPASGSQRRRGYGREPKPID